MRMLRVAFAVSALDLSMSCTTRNWCLFGISPEKGGKTLCTIRLEGNPVKAAALIREAGLAKLAKSG